MPHKWNTDFASDKPEHVRRQGFPPETGPDTRQPDMVSREKVIGILNKWLNACKEPEHAITRDVILNLKFEVRKL